jgi:hypothetical protein
VLSAELDGDTLVILTSPESPESNVLVVCNVASDNVHDGNVVVASADGATTVNC